MSKVMVKTVVGLFMALVLLISMTTLALADPGLQQWFLDSETTAPGYEMEKKGGPGDNGQTGNVTVANGTSVIWLADEAAVCNVTFPGGDSWIIKICTDSDWGKDGDKCETKIGGWNTTTGWYELPTSTQGTITWDGGQKILTVEFQANNATIWQGDYLALKIKNNNDDVHTVYTEGCSYLQSPCGDPGYPVAEVISGILLGLGLVGLAGYTGWKRRKASIEA